jgi:hypothetical protein
MKKEWWISILRPDDIPAISVERVRDILTLPSSQGASFLLAVGTGADLIDNGLLEIDKDCSSLRQDKIRKKS